MTLERCSRPGCDYWPVQRVKVTIIELDNSEQAFDVFSCPEHMKLLYPVEVTPDCCTLAILVAEADGG